jgi:hypothetical protein
VVNPAIHGCLAISTICALSAPSVNSLTLRSDNFVIPTTFSRLAPEAEFIPFSLQNNQGMKLAFLSNFKRSARHLGSIMRAIS